MTKREQNTQGKTRKCNTLIMGISEGEESKKQRKYLKIIG